MPNYCDYTMRIVGDKKDRDRAVEIIQSDYNGTKDDPVHLWRVFEAIIYDEDDESTELSGYCAWSVASCMLGDIHSYNYDDTTGRGTCLEEITKMFNLKIEIFSTESGMCFAEHYIIDNGIIKKYEVNDFYCIECDEYNSYEELLKYISTLDNNNGNTFVVTKEQYEQEDFIEIGNFDCEFSI